MSATQRMLAFEAVYLSAAAKTDGVDPDGRYDPLQALYSSVASRDGVIMFAPIGALLLAELDAWQANGLQLGYFEGERRFQDAVANSDVLKVYSHHMEGGASSDLNTPTTADGFQDALLDAVEDLRAERLELLQLLLVATDDQFVTRIEGVHFAASQIAEIESSSTAAPDLAWVLTGRESAMDAWAGPAAWRTDGALGTHPRFPAVNEASATLALASLVRNANPESFAEVLELLERHTGEDGIALR